MNDTAEDIEKRFLSFFIGLFFLKIKIMMNRNGRGKGYFKVRGEILRSLKEQHQRRHFPITFPLVKSESGGIEDD